MSACKYITYFFSKFAFADPGWDRNDRIKKSN